MAKKFGGVGIEPEGVAQARLLKRTIAPGMVLQGDIAAQLTALGVEFPSYVRTDAEAEAICAALDARIAALMPPDKDSDQPVATADK